VESISIEEAVEACLGETASLRQPDHAQDA
jgi:hypothetical protein